MKNNSKKIVVGLSGGVDSSVALVLLKQKGWEPIGVSLKYCVWADKNNLLQENKCCSAESFAIAKKVCKKLNVPHYIFDVSKDFQKQVINYFIKELKQNKTPNPCVICNPNLKFKKLFEFAEKHKIKYVATGHYARIGEVKNQKSLLRQACLPARQGYGGQAKVKSQVEYQLLKAKDKLKDQSYSLAFLPQRYLSKIIFPLGNYTKNEIYKIAKKQGFNFYSKQKQSQDFCFVAGKSMQNFLSKKIEKKNGEIQDKSGKVLAKHQGLHFYTIGQRKGIKLPGGPYFVIGFDVKKNILIVSKNKKDLFSKSAILSPIHFINSVQITQDKFKAKVKIRSQHSGALANVKIINKNKAQIIFNKVQPAITPGQFAVFYQGQVCLGGGRILLNNFPAK